MWGPETWTYELWKTALLLPKLFKTEWQVYWDLFFSYSLCQSGIQKSFVTSPSPRLHAHLLVYTPVGFEISLPLAKMLTVFFERKKTRWLTDIYRWGSYCTDKRKSHAIAKYIHNLNTNTLRDMSGDLPWLFWRRQERSSWPTNLACITHNNRKWTKNLFKNNE